MSKYKSRYKQRVVRSMLTKRYLSKISYLSGLDKKSLNEAFLNPLKKQSKTGKELYTQRSFEKVQKFYQNIRIKESVVTRRVSLKVDGVRKQRNIFYLPKGNQLRPFSGKKRKKVEGVIKRMNRYLFFKKTGFKSLKQIREQENLSNKQFKQFRDLISGQGFSRDGKMSKRFGYLYKSWVEQRLGEDFDSDKHRDNSAVYSMFKEDIERGTFFNYSISFIKEQFD